MGVIFLRHGIHYPLVRRLKLFTESTHWTTLELPTSDTDSKSVDFCMCACDRVFVFTSNSSGILSLGYGILAEFLYLFAGVCTSASMRAIVDFTIWLWKTSPITQLASEDSTINVRLHLKTKDHLNRIIYGHPWYVCDYMWSMYYHVWVIYIYIYIYVCACS